jgi:hypothetical protein
VGQSPAGKNVSTETIKSISEPLYIYSYTKDSLSPGVNWPGHEADHSSPSGTKVKNGGAVERVQ